MYSWRSLQLTILFLCLFAVAAAGLGGYFYYRGLARAVAAEEHSRGRFEVERVSRTLSGIFREQRRAVSLVSRNETFAAALAGSGSIDEANRELEIIQKSMSASAGYLMDSSGVTVAASNWDEPGSFVGKNYAFRPYFTNAISGTPYQYMAVGVTSKTPGVYFSHPVYGAGGGAPTGVIVIKAGLVRVMEELLQVEQGTVSLLSPEGVVFASNRPDWLYGLFWKKSPAVVDAIAASSQFGPGPFEWIGFQRTGPTTLLDRSGEKIFIHEVASECCRDWSIAYTHYQSSLSGKVMKSFLSVGGTVVASLVLFVALGGFLFVYQISRVIQSRKRAEADLQQSEERFRKLTLLSPAGVFMTDNAGGCVYVNRKWSEMTGLDAEEGVGGGWMRAVHPDDRENVASSWETMVNAGGTWGREFRLVTPGDKVTWVFGMATPLLDDEGRPSGYIGTTVDLTARKEAEQILMRSNQILEEKIRSRTAELAEANLRLMEMDELKNMFLASMSHELRTPLNAIIGFTGIMLQGLSGDLQPEQHRQLDMVKRSADHLLDLVNDIIDIAKIQAGGVSPDMEEFEITALFHETAGKYAESAAAKGLQFIVNGDEEVVVCTDRNRVRKVVNILVDNAVKFTDEGLVGIECVLEGEGARIVVRDSGRGIAEEDRERIFQPFSKATGTEHDDNESPGIGLYLARRIAALLGGTISCRSVPGEGSEFVFLFPAICAEGDPPGEKNTVGERA